MGLLEGFFKCQIQLLQWHYLFLSLNLSIDTLNYDMMNLVGNSESICEIIADISRDDLISGVKKLQKRENVISKEL